MVDWAARQMETDLSQAAPMGLVHRAFGVCHVAQSGLPEWLLRDQGPSAGRCHMGSLDASASHCSEPAFHL
jgi:hypothetical protein